MNYYCKLLLLLWLLILLSCKKNNYRNITVSEINISNIFSKTNKVNLSSIAENITYIAIQSDSVCYLNRIKNIKKNISFFDNQILINDESSNFLIFDFHGKYLYRIGHKGRGPGEYHEVNEYTVFPRNNIICIYSAALQKTLFFTFKGKFIKDIPINFWPLGLTSINHDLVFVNTLGRRNFTNFHSISIISQEGVIKKRLFFKSKEKLLNRKIKFGLKSFIGDFHVLNDTTYFFENSSYEKDTIWKITNEFLTIPKYTINYGDNKMPLYEHTNTNLKSFEGLIKYDYMRFFMESSKYLFLEIYKADKKKLHKVLYNKITKESSCLEFKKEFGKGVNFSFYNDIDGGMPFWPQGYATENKVFMLIYGYELKEYLDRKGDDVEVLDKEAREKLLQLAENSKVSDNPILMVVTLKE